MLVFVALMVAGLLLPPAGDLLGGSAAAIPVALVLGAGAAALYARFAGVRSFATVLSPAPLIVLVLFLVVSPVNGLMFPAEAGPRGRRPGALATPIVQIVLDELPQTTLAGADGEIDAELFPNSPGSRERRPGTATRPRSTTSPRGGPGTAHRERPAPGPLPTARDHPRSLFTLFERSHELTVIEPITDLCPERLCADERAGTVDRLAVAASPTSRSSCSTCCCRRTCATACPRSTASGRGSRPAR